MVATCPACACARWLALVLAALLLGGCASVPNYVDGARAAHAAACPERDLPARAFAQPVNIALSGGGYRAMLFHVGTLWRLHELGLLGDTAHVSSVSAGSITSAVLARQWRRVASDWGDDAAAVPQRTTCFRALVAEPLMQLAGRTIDVPAVLEGLVPPFSAAGRIEATYKQALYGDVRLGELPEVPKFVFNATNLQTGGAWIFRRDVMGEPALGYTPAGTVHLAEAVAASTAFPPYLSPLMFRPRDTQWRLDDTGSEHPKRSLRRRKGSPLDRNELDRFRAVVPLVDGGVADNLGVESIWDLPGALLISDGGGFTLPDATPGTNWLAQMIRVLELVDDQPSELRANAFVELQRLRDRAQAPLVQGAPYDRDGAYWDIAELPATHRGYCPSPVDAQVVEALWNMPTRMQAMPETTRKQLVNWGYHAADYAMPYLRRLMRGSAVHRMSARLPYPEAPIFVTDKLRACMASGHWEGP